MGLNTVLTGFANTAGSCDLLKTNANAGTSAINAAGLDVVKLDAAIDALTVVATALSGAAIPGLRDEEKYDLAAQANAAIVDLTFIKEKVVG